MGTVGRSWAGIGVGSTPTSVGAVGAAVRRGAGVAVIRIGVGGPVSTTSTVGATVGTTAAAAASCAAYTASARLTSTVLPRPRQYNALAARNTITSNATPIRCSSERRLYHA